MAMQNSNPTILSKADLPTRQQKSRHSAANSASQYASEIFGHDLLAVPFHDPFAASYVNGSSSGSESEDDDLMEEPIDEQEIYGAYPESLAQPTPKFPTLKKIQYTKN